MVYLILEIFRYIFNALFYSGDFKAYIVFKKVNRKEQN